MDLCLAESYEDTSPIFIYNPGFMILRGSSSVNNQLSLPPWFEDKNPKRVCVLGDIILDEYLEGKVTRISPEAPVPVHLVTNTTRRAGGAANAALNIQRVGGEAMLVGVWGADDAANDLNKLLREQSIDTSNVLIDTHRPTIRKTRITADKQQMVRVDWEKVTPIAEDIEAELLGRISSNLFDALLMSDYGKGGLSPSFIAKAIAVATKAGSKVIVDPKGVDYHHYKGAYLITPNRMEACLALGLDPLGVYDRRDLAQGLQEKYGLKNILLTLGSEGMYFYPEPGSSDKDLYLPAQTQEVFDVSGAGDTVAAVYTLSVAYNVPTRDAMCYANLAAGKVVAKWGTQPVEASELLDAVQFYTGNQKTDSKFSSKPKIKTLNDLTSLLKPPATRSKKVVFTNGCFDLIHAGHVDYLEKARSLGDTLIVAVNSDESVSRLKGKNRPIVPCDQRMKVLAALGCVDYVFSFSEDTPEDVIKSIKPDVLIKGADYKINEIAGADFVQSYGGRVDTVEMVAGVSTTDIVKKISAKS